MLAHLNGQLANYSQLSNSLGVSSNSVKNYCELLANTFMIHMIPPFLPNIGKRLVKSPKIYLADHGVLLSLLGIETYDELLGHPIFGYHWESVVLSQIMALFPRANISHYRTSHGNEIDFVVEIRGEVIAIECKASTNPSLTKGNYSAIADLKAKHNFVVSPVNESWPIANNISICSLSNLKNEITGKLKNS